MIEAFKNSNLASDWKLEIYGINDNQKYFETIKSWHQQIQIF